MNILSKIIITGLLFLMSIGNGIFLHHLGRPLNNTVFTIHKLLALGTGIFAVILIYNLIKSTEVTTTTSILIIISGLTLLSTLVSGGLLSFEKFSNSITLIIHNTATILFAISSVVAIFLLSR